MSKPYRPEGWDNPMPCSECVKITRGINCAVSCHQYIRYSEREAGADALLEALLKSNEPSCEVFVSSTGARAYGKQYPGKLVFIPEEK